MEMTMDAFKTSGTSPPRVADQADTVMVSVASIMRDPAFREGVEEYRTGKRPNFDKRTLETGAWNYERGRQWAILAKRKGHPDLKPRGWLASLVYEGGVCS
jgi:hypothetical protein